MATRSGGNVTFLSLPPLAETNPPALKKHNESTPHVYKDVKPERNVTPLEEVGCLSMEHDCGCQNSRYRCEMLQCCERPNVTATHVHKQVTVIVALKVHCVCL